MTLALYGKSRKRKGGLLAAAVLAVIVAMLGGVASLGGAGAAGPGDNGAPTSGNHTDLKNAAETFTSVLISDNSLMACTGTTAQSFSTVLSFHLSATSPAGAYFVLYLDPNNGSNASPAENVPMNEVQVPVGGLAAGDYAINVSLPVTHAFTATTGGVLIVIADDVSGMQFNDKSNSLNCTEGTTGTVSVEKTNDAPNSTIAAGGTFNWIITATVSGGPSAAATTITDTAPTGMTFGAITKSVGGTADPSKLMCTTTSGSPVSCTVAASAPVGTYTVTIATTAPAASNINNCKLYTNEASFMIDGTPGTSSDSVTVTGCSAPTLPAVTKVAHTPNTDGTFAYWDIVIDQPPANSAAQTVVVTDGHSDIQVVSSTGSVCGTATAGVFTCNILANTDVTVVVKRPITNSTLATGNLCMSGTIDNYLLSAVIGQSSVLGSAGNSDHKVSYTVQDTTTCGQPSVTKTLVGNNPQSTSDPSQVKWQILVSNPANGAANLGIDVRDSGVTILSGPTYTGSATCSTGALTDTNGTHCAIPAGGSVTWTVVPSSTPARTCAEQQFPNTAQFNVSAAWQDFSGPTITLTGDNTLCTRTIRVGKVTSTATHPAATFAGTITPGTPGAFSVGLTANQAVGTIVDYTMSSQAAQTVVETTLPANWALDGYSVTSDPTGTLTCSNTMTFSTDNVVSAGAGTYLVCIKNHYTAPPVTINASKIVCNSEASLPDFPFTGRPINETTASAFVDAHKGDCHLEAGWSFEWGFGNGSGPIAQIQPGSTTGAVAPNHGWNAFNSTSSATAGQFATATITDMHGASGNDALWVREVLQPNYLPFSDSASTNPSYSAELGCYNDAINYDNYDSIDGPVAGGTYYCVAWNVAVRQVTIKKVVTNVENDATTFGIKQDSLTNAIGSISETGPALVTKVDTGEHTFNEVVPAGYALDGAFFANEDGSCGSQPPVPQFLNVAQVAADFTLPSGTDDAVICFYNHKVQGQLIIEKENIGGIQSDVFTADITGGAQNIPFSAEDPSDAQILAPGTYTVTEDAKAGYTYLGYTIGSCQPEEEVFLGALTADEGQLADGPASVTIVDGEDTIVCFHNDGRAHITIEKIDQTGAVPTPPRPADGTWHFSVTDGEQTFTTEITGSGTHTFDVPVGGTFTATEREALTGACPTVNESGTFRTTLTPEGSQTITAPGQTIKFTFVNQACDIVLGTGSLVIHKIGDLNGNHVQDGSETGIQGWAMTVTGPQFPGGQVFYTDASGTITELFGIKDGQYTITEENRSGYSVIGVVNGNGTFSAGSTVSTATVALGETTEVTFYNQPLVNIHVTKTELTNGGLHAGDGWKVTLTGCGITQQATTAVDGSADFTNLPLCANYTVSEDITSKAGFSPMDGTSRTVAATVAGTTYNVAFRNSNVTVCTNCTNVTPTPTTPTSTPTATPTNTPTSTPTATPTKGQSTDPGTKATPTPVDAVLGEKTPGPGAQSTPLAPSTGSGMFGGNGGSANIAFALMGLIALGGGLTIMAFGKRKRS